MKRVNENISENKIFMFSFWRKMVIKGLLIYFNNKEISQGSSHFYVKLFLNIWSSIYSNYFSLCLNLFFDKAITNRFRIA